MQVDAQLLWDATDTLLHTLEQAGASTTWLSSDTVVIGTSRISLMVALHEAALQVHAYFPIQGEPHRSRAHLQRAREDLTAAEAAQSIGVPHAREAVRLWELEVARVDAVTARALEIGADEA